MHSFASYLNGFNMLGWENFGFNHQMISISQWETNTRKKVPRLLTLLASINFCFMRYLCICEITTSHVHIFRLNVAHTCDAHRADISLNFCSHIYNNQQFHDHICRDFLCHKWKRNETGKEIMYIKWKGQVLARESIVQQSTYNKN